MFNKILCLFGIHKPGICNKFYPSMSADIIEEYKFSVVCSRCTKELGSEHNVWNEETREFEKADPRQHDLML